MRIPHVPYVVSRAFRGTPGCRWRWMWSLAGSAGSRLCGLAGVDLGCGRHVMRLELIQRIPRTGLADPGPGTVGPAAGLVVQPRRNRYAVPAGWVIACVVLVAARSGVRQR